MSFGDDGEGEPIQLYVYDLSNGMARSMGPMMGVNIEGIWHTSLVLYNLEIFYGQGIDIVQPPGTTHHGVPVKKMRMGTTALDRDTVLAYIEGIRETWTAEKYHLLDFNCNSFTQDVLSFLNGRSIPQDIIDLPKTVLATPFGQQMRPMIDQMFRGTSSNTAARAPPRPEASDAVRSLLPPTTVGTNSISSNFQICTSPASLRAVLAHANAVAVMFTSPRCAPCHAIKPVFEQLARAHANIDFVIVDISAGGGDGNAIARESEFGGPVTATPSFVFFDREARVVGSCRGADKAQLEKEVELLATSVAQSAPPPHPHTQLDHELPQLKRLTRSLAPITYVAFPALPALSAKLESTLSGSSLAPEQVATLTETVVKYLATLPATPASASSPPPPDLTRAWTTATFDALAALDHDHAKWFPILDLVRLALARDSARLSTDSTFVAFWPQLVARVTAKDVLDSDDINKSLLLTLVRLISNALAAPALSSVMLSPSPHLSSSSDSSESLLLGLTRLIVRALLFDQDKGVRSAGAGLAWSIVGRIWAARASARRTGLGKSVEVEAAGGEGGGEEWEVEVASAVLEALGREEESGEVVHRLTATLGLLLYHSPHYEAIVSLLQVLDVETVLDGREEMLLKVSGKADGAASDKKTSEAVELVREVKRLCRT